ncbi:hypothetical protein HOLleu_27804 [Holothuria leucospilota]|uniref:Uncharacterized protein n=1 Tax=Holothuria leucospilota TaxID=206669 RepID=A0A9Q1BR83_HOLLE|nr:hypothetical protein HOLleu_27804 [Holothuria leucospilota]
MQFFISFFLQRLENPQEPSIYNRVPKNPKGLYDKPVTNPRPFNILHCRSFNISREEATLTQMYSQMSFLANAVRNTDGTTSYKLSTSAVVLLRKLLSEDIDNKNNTENLCINPASQLMPSKDTIHERDAERSDSLRWPSASLSRPIPRLLLPLRPGSSTQWYAWKVDTPRKKVKKPKGSTKRDADVPFVHQFRGDTSIKRKTETNEACFLEDTPREVAPSNRQTHNSFVSEIDPGLSIAPHADVIEDTKGDGPNEKTVLESQITDVNETFLTQSGMSAEEISVKREDEKETNAEVEIKVEGPEEPIKDEKPEEATSLTDERVISDQTKVKKTEKKEISPTNTNDDGKESLRNTDKDGENYEIDETPGNETSDETNERMDEEKETIATSNDEGEETTLNKDQDAENCKDADETTGNETSDILDNEKDDSTEGGVVEESAIQEPRDCNENHIDMDGTDSVHNSGNTEEKTLQNEDNQKDEIKDGINVELDHSDAQDYQGADESGKSNEENFGERDEASDMAETSDLIL